jgi:hypothetical protein
MEFTEEHIKFIEKEVNRRVDFKMSEFKTGMVNRIQFNERVAFMTTLKENTDRNAIQYTLRMEGLQEAFDAFNKEASMGVPFKIGDKEREAKRHFIDSLMDRLDSVFRGTNRWDGNNRRSMLDYLVAEVEKLQSA